MDRRGSYAASPVAASEGCHGRALSGNAGQEPDDTSGPQGGVTADQATTLRTLIEGELNKDQIAKARAEAKAFKPKG